jgi:hypothetical protein
LSKQHPTLRGKDGITKTIQQWAETSWALGTDGGMWGDPYFDYILDYWSCREDPRVLLVCYEKLCANMTANIDRIASFIFDRESANQSELCERVAPLCSRQYMLENVTKFGA